MSMQMCEKCGDPQTLVDTDYHCEIYREGIDINYKTGELSFTGDEKDVAPLCEECLEKFLKKEGVNEEKYFERFGY